MNVADIYSQLSDHDLLRAIKEVQHLRDKAAWPESAPMKETLVQQIVEITQQVSSHAISLHESLVSREAMDRFARMLWRPADQVPDDSLLNDKGFAVFQAFRPAMDIPASQNGLVTYCREFGWNDHTISHYAPLLSKPEFDHVSQ